MISKRLVPTVVLAFALLAATPAFAQAPKPLPTPDAADRARPQGFSVVLVLGDTKSAAAMDDSVPPAARKALADMKDFLPYKGYRLLDVQWILGSDRASTRLRGVDEQEYQLTLRAFPYRTPQSVNVMFQLQEPGAADTAINYTDDGQRRAQLAAMQDRRRQLELEIAALREKTGDDQRALNESRRALNAQLAEMKRQIEQAEGGLKVSRGRSVIDTNFIMDIGETVVVGTSRIRGGDKALIALLTAVPRNGATKKD